MYTPNCLGDMYVYTPHCLCDMYTIELVTLVVCMCIHPIALGIFRVLCPSVYTCVMFSELPTSLGGCFPRGL